jgi:trehalose 6-phosphate phosphatase
MTLGAGQIDPDLKDEATRRLADRCMQILQNRPAALATDIDGTISPIAPTPDLAHVEPQAIEALSELTAQLALVVVLTGRTAVDAEGKVKLADVLYIGNHGLERRWQGQTSDNPVAIESIESIRRALFDIDREVRDQGLDEGLLIEDKQLTASIHYRLSPDRDRIGPPLGTIVHTAALNHGLRMTQGRYVFELRPQVLVNKGTAAEDVIREHGLKGIVFLGDDVTDIDAFRSVRNLRDEGVVRGVSIAVNSPETKAVVLEEADEVVEGVGGAVKLLTEVAARFGSMESLVDCS